MTPVVLALGKIGVQELLIVLAILLLRARKVRKAQDMAEAENTPAGDGDATGEASEPSRKENK